MRYDYSVEDLMKQNEKILKQNSNLIQEIRNLRCAMIEAATCINPTYEPELFKYLISESSHFITHKVNPYPEHDDMLSDQYLKFLQTSEL